MKTMNRIIAACGMAAALMLPAAAQATGYGKKHHGNYYDGPPVAFGFSFSYVDDRYYGKGGQNKHRKHQKHYKHQKHHRHGKSYHGKPGYLPHYAYQSTPRYYQGYGRGVHGCHPVTRIEFHHGRKAKFGGTMCYDRWGQSFIVPGSRHVMHYFH